MGGGGTASAGAPFATSGSLCTRGACRDVPGVRSCLTRSQPPVAVHSDLARPHTSSDAEQGGFISAVACVAHDAPQPHAQALRVVGSPPPLACRSARLSAWACRSNRRRRCLPGTTPRRTGRRRTGPTGGQPRRRRPVGYRPGRARAARRTAPRTARPGELASPWAGQPCSSTTGRVSAGESECKSAPVSAFAPAARGGRSPRRSRPRTWHAPRRWVYPAALLIVQTAR